MTPTVRSRLMAAGTAFLLGFAVANYGILAIPNADRWIWLIMAVVLMMTGVVGVLIADSPRHISVWAVVGLEIFAAFTLIPLLWMFTVATSSRPDVPTTVTPQDIDWSAFGHAVTSDVFGRPLVNSVVVALVSTAIAVAVAVPAAYAVSRLNTVYGPWLYSGAVALLLAPTIIFNSAISDALRSVGLLDTLLAPMLGSLLLTVPLAFWLCVSVIRDVPWTLRDAVIVDGASTRELLRTFVIPIVGPGVLVAAGITFLAALNDVVVSATMLSSGSARTLPGTILLAGEARTGDAQAVAVALVLLVPAAVLLLSVPRRILLLLGRTYR